MCTVFRRRSIWLCTTNKPQNRQFYSDNVKQWRCSYCQVNSTQRLWNNVGLTLFSWGEGGKREITDHRHVLETHKRQDKADSQYLSTVTAWKIVYDWDDSNYEPHLPGLFLLEAWDGDVRKETTWVADGSSNWRVERFDSSPSYNYKLNTNVFG